MHAAFSDYEPVNSALTFSNERVSHVISVKIEDDEIDEENEYLLAVIQFESELLGVQLASNYTILTIEDNDSKTSLVVRVLNLQLIFFIIIIGITIGIEFTNYTVNERDSRVQVCVTLNGILERTVYLSLTTADNSATSRDPRDFTALSDELQFNQNTSTLCINISISNDNKVEYSENFMVGISGNDSDVDYGTRHSTVTVIDDDKAFIEFEKAENTGKEGETIQVCARIRNGTLERSISVVVNTKDVSTNGLMPS